MNRRRNRHIGLVPVLAMAAAAAVALLEAQGTSTPAAPTGAPGRDNLPPSEEAARAALARSPRDGQWVEVLDGLQATHVFVVHSERLGRSPLVVLVPDHFGMSDWIRAVADQLAREGFSALVPDLLTGAGPGRGNTESFASAEAVTKAFNSLTAEQARAHINSAWNFGLRMPGMTGMSAIVGVGEGGVHALTFASQRRAIRGAVVFEASPPSAEVLSRIAVPVLAFHAPGDTAAERITAEMKRRDKAYEAVVLEGAGPRFLRAQSARDANLRAVEQAWPKAVTFLRDLTRPS